MISKVGWCNFKPIATRDESAWIHGGQGESVEPPYTRGHVYLYLSQHVKLKYEATFYNFLFNFNLRRYSKGKELNNPLDPASGGA
jgi:hypothetical protein